MGQLNFDSYTHVKDNSNKNNIKNKKDVIFELYNKNLLTIERLQNKMKNYEITSKLIKILIKDKKVNLLDVIFSNLSFYDNDFILQLLFFYKNKISISTSDLIQQISNEKFKILTGYGYNENIDKYLYNECEKKDINIYI